jgi:hypothetical protein
MLELYGKEVVALALGLGTMQSPGMGGGATLFTAVMMKVLGNQDAAGRWLQEKRDLDDRRDTDRFWGMLVLTFIAAGMAVIAAWPIIRGSSVP